MTTREFANLTGEVRDLDYKEWWDMHEHYVKSPFQKDVYCEAWRKMYEAIGVAPGLKGFEKPDQYMFENYVYRVLAARARKRYIEAVKKAEQAECVEEITSK